MSPNFLSGYINIDEWCTNNGFNKAQVLRLARENRLKLAKVANSTFIVKQDLEDFLYKEILNVSQRRLSRIENKKNNYRKIKVIADAINSTWDLADITSIRLFIKFLRENDTTVDLWVSEFREWSDLHAGDQDIINPDPDQDIFGDGEETDEDIEIVNTRSRSRTRARTNRNNNNRSNADDGTSGRGRTGGRGGRGRTGGRGDNANPNPNPGGGGNDGNPNPGGATNP